MDGIMSKKDSKFRDEPQPPETVIIWNEMALALAQVLIGNLMVVAGTLSISYYCELCYVSTGIWVGFMVLATGVLGVMESSREDNWGLTRAYAISLCCTLILSLVLLGVEIAGAVIDGERCGNPILRNSTTTVSPPSRSPSHYTTMAPIDSNCVLECVYIHGSLSAFGLLDLVASALCIYLALQSMKNLKASPPPYKAMVAEPIPYKQAI